jgi:hypothetical protein
MVLLALFFVLVIYVNPMMVALQPARCWADCSFRLRVRDYRRTAVEDRWHSPS